MKKIIFCLGILLGLGGVSHAQTPQTPSAQTPSAQPQERPAISAMSTLCRVDAMLAALDGGATKTPAAAPATCTVDDSFTSGLRYLTKTTQSVDPTALTRSIVSYHLYRALTTGNITACAALGALQAVAELSIKNDGGATWAGRCEASYHQLRFARALMTRAPDLATVCNASLASRDNSGARPDPKATDALCKKIVASANDPKALVAAVCGAQPEAGQAGCRDSIAAMSGDLASCRRANNAEKREVCFGIAAYSHAAKTQDAAKCDNDAVCLALLGDPKLSGRAKGAVTRILAPAILGEAHRMLAALDTATDTTDLATINSIDARENRIAHMLQSLAPATAPKKSAPQTP